MPNINGHGASGATERVALYLRVSSEEQRERETIDIQREFLEQYCELYGLEVAEVYADDGVSGTIPLHERLEGRRLLEDAKEGNFGVVLVYKLDRLGRTLLVIVDAHDRLETSGVSLRSATEPIDTSSPSGRLIFQMLASFAEYERGTIRERTQAGLRRALRNGQFLGRIPYGYKLSSDETSLTLVEEEAQIVREIIANVAAGATLYSESKRLNDEGISSPGYRFRGDDRRRDTRLWTASTVGRIVHQTAYSGVHRVRVEGRGGQREIIARPVPAIVEPGVRERAEAQVSKNKSRAGELRKNGRKYLLSGLVRCGICGQACSGRGSTGRVSGGIKKYFYYRCISNRGERRSSNASEGGKPSHCVPNIPADWLEGLVWTDVRAFLENPGEVLERVREQMQSDDASAELEARRTDLSKRLAAKSAEKDRYVRAFAAGHISEEELAEYVTDLKNQIDNLKLLIGGVEIELTREREQVEAAESVAGWLLTLRERIHEVEGDTPEAFQKRRELVRLLVEGVTTDRDENGHLRVEITYRFGPPPGEPFVPSVPSMSNSPEFEAYETQPGDHPMWYRLTGRDTKWSELCSARSAGSGTMTPGVVEPLVGGKGPMDSDLDNSLRA
jgi:site-specific DNA recombinase